MLENIVHVSMLVTPIPTARQSIVMNVSVCLSVRHHVFVRIFTKFYVHITYGCGSVLLWQSSDKLIKLHISSFTDDVIFAHKLCH